TVAIKQAEHDCLSHRPTSFDVRHSPADVHVPRLASDEGFVRLNLPSHLIECSVVHRVPNSVKHEPCSFLRYFQSAGNLIGAYAVLAVRNHPHGNEPFIEWNRRGLKDGSDFDGKLFFAIQTLPHQARPEKGQSLGLAAWASWTPAPTYLGYSLNADIGV